MIVKASNIITPNYIFKEEKTSLEDNLVLELSEESKVKFRAYLRLVKKLNPTLNEESRQKI
jgi:hypothetical protein